MSSPPRIESVLVVEDRAPDLAFITGVVQSAFGDVEVRTARSLARAREHLSEVAPDLVVLDLNLPDGRGVELITAIRERRPGAWIVVVTVFDDDEHLFTALQQGADGYLLKDESRASAAGILRDVLAGHPPLSARVARRVLRYVQSSAPSAKPVAAFELTAREREVVVLLARGHTAASTAAALDISEHTVKTHIKNLYRKLDVSTRAGLVRTAIDTGLA